MYDSVIKLVKETKTVNDLGDTVVQTTERPVFCEVVSIGMTEFYQAQATGLRPEIKFILADYLDYNGEQALKYQQFAGTEQEYSVIRTYRNGNELEITAKRGVDV